MLRLFRRRSGAPLIAALLTLAGCDRAPADPVDVLEVNEVILRGDDDSFSFSHADHWHGAPAVRVGETAGFTVFFTSLRPPPDEHAIPPVESWFTLEDHAEYAMRVVIEDTTIAVWADDRVRGLLTGRREGASRMSIVVTRGPTTIYEAPPLNFRVRAAEE